MTMSISVNQSTHLDVIVSAESAPYVSVWTLSGAPVSAGVATDRGRCNSRGPELPFAPPSVAVSVGPRQTLDSPVPHTGFAQTMSLSVGCAMNRNLSNPTKS